MQQPTAAGTAAPCDAAGEDAGTTHRIAWLHDHDQVRADFTCAGPDDAWCRLRCTCDDGVELCSLPEAVCDVEGHDRTGAHCCCCGGTAITGGHPCAPTEWMRADDQHAPIDAYRGREEALHDGPIVYTWRGDHYTWRYAQEAQEADVGGAAPFALPQVRGLLALLDGLHGGGECACRGSQVDPRCRAGADAAAELDAYDRQLQLPGIWAGAATGELGSGERGATPGRPA